MLKGGEKAIGVVKDGFRGSFGKQSHVEQCWQSKSRLRVLRLHRAGKGLSDRRENEEAEPTTVYAD